MIIFCKYKIRILVHHFLCISSLVKQFGHYTHNSHNRILYGCNRLVALRKNTNQQKYHSGNNRIDKMSLFPPINQIYAYKYNAWSMEIDTKNNQWKLSKLLVTKICRLSIFLIRVHYNLTTTCIFSTITSPMRTSNAPNLQHLLPIHCQFPIHCPHNDSKLKQNFHNAIFFLTPKQPYNYIVKLLYNYIATYP